MFGIQGCRATQTTKSRYRRWAATAASSVSKSMVRLYIHYLNTDILSCMFCCYTCSLNTPLLSNTSSARSFSNTRTHACFQTSSCSTQSHVSSAHARSHVSVIRSQTSVIRILLSHSFFSHLSPVSHPLRVLLSTAFPRTCF